MALIQYTINKSASGAATVTCTIQSISPGDKITFVTDQPGTAIQCGGSSPFDAPSVGDLYVVPMNGANSDAIAVSSHVQKPGICEWVCGEIIGGKFTPWPGTGPNFPPVKSL